MFFKKKTSVQKLRERPEWYVRELPDTVCVPALEGHRHEAVTIPLEDATLRLYERPSNSRRGRASSHTSHADAARAIARKNQRCQPPAPARKLNAAPGLRT